MPVVPPPMLAGVRAVVSPAGDAFSSSLFASERNRRVDRALTCLAKNEEKKQAKKEEESKTCAAERDSSGDARQVFDSPMSSTLRSTGTTSPFGEETATEIST